MCHPLLKPNIPAIEQPQILKHYATNLPLSPFTKVKTRGIVETPIARMAKPWEDAFLYCAVMCCT